MKREVAKSNLVFFLMKFNDMIKTWMVYNLIKLNKLNLLKIILNLSFLIKRFKISRINFQWLNSKLTKQKCFWILQ